jgi:hypothetical protein
MDTRIQLELFTLQRGTTDQVYRYILYQKETKMGSLSSLYREILTCIREDYMS